MAKPHPSQDVPDSSIGIRRAWRQLWLTLRRDKVPELALAVVAVILVGAIGFMVYEQGGQADEPGPIDGMRRVVNSLWWSVVTIITEGYGDYTPKTTPGRAVGAFVMFGGLILISLVTAVLASMFVERKIREERGLQAVTIRDHMVICGWNEHAEDVLTGVRMSRAAPKEVVLVNELEEERINDVRYQLRGALAIHFVRGDFTLESVLARANIARAGSAIVLADTSGEHSLANADERAILGTLAIKEVAPRVPVCVEILNEKSEPHLRRARADEIIVRGRHAGCLIASAVLSPGVPQAINTLLDFAMKTHVSRRPIPKEFIGRTFGELGAHFAEHGEHLLIGFAAAPRQITLTDILADDLSSIDQFIKQKFAEAGEDVVGGRRLRVLVNPPSDYLIQEDDFAIVITGQEDERPS